MQNVDRILKSIVNGKKQTGWTDLKKIKNLESFDEIKGILMEHDLIIGRRLVEYKLKNGLTEEIIMNLR